MLAVAWPGPGAGGKTMKIVSCIMTGNNTLNYIHLAVTDAAAEAEIKYIWRGNRTKATVSALGLCMQL